MRNIVYNEKIGKIFFRTDITQKSITELAYILYHINHKNNKYNKKIDLHIMSNGGDCHCGFLGYDLLKLSKVPIHTYCDGFIASSASVLFLGGKQRFMTKNSFIMIHQLSVDNFYGKHYEIEDLYQNTNSIMNNMKNIYLEETKISKDFLNYLLQRDLYLNSKICLENGFINKIL